MLGPMEYLRGMEGVWAAWLGGVLVLLVGLTRAARTWRWPDWRRLAREEAGASYTLSYLVVIPIYLLFVCLVFEATFLIIGKVGTLYAAHAGARSAIVWQSAQPADLRQQRMEQSVWTAMAPFATAATASDLATVGPPPGDSYRQAAEWAFAYQLYSSASAQQAAPRPRPYPRSNAPLDFLVRKYLNAAMRTTFEIQTDNSKPDGDVTCTVTYRARLLIPGPARLFATASGRWPYSRQIVSRATLPNEVPVSADQTLGIDYRSR
jgi:hypothetical protein